MPALTRESAFSLAACVKVLNERTGFVGNAVEVAVVDPAVSDNR
jgi:hypothetical protein